MNASIGIFWELLPLAIVPQLWLIGAIDLAQKKRLAEHCQFLRIVDLSFDPASAILIGHGEILQLREVGPDMLSNHPLGLLAFTLPMHVLLASSRPLDLASEASAMDLRHQIRALLCDSVKPASCDQCPTTMARW
ncbi:MAG: hypothetical protein ACI89J_003097 [Hyphomicrobiaceae bacterium]